MKRSAIAAALSGAVLLQGCTNPSGASMGLFSATAPVLAVLADDLFTGTAVGYADRTGTIDIKSTVTPDLRCVGSFRYTGSSTGVAQVKCNDGAEASLNFNSLSLLSGYGVGKSTRGPASFTYGLTPEEASQYLGLPKGKKIQKTEGSTRLVDA